MVNLNAAWQQVKKYALCSVCGTPLIGIAHEDAWGNHYCAHHSTELPRCSCCQRLICNRLTSGGVAYRDGRLVCNLCRKTAVDTKEQAKPYVDAVAAWLFKKGLAFQNLFLHFKLVYRDELVQALNLSAGEPQGVIYRSTSGRPLVRKVDGVAILKGLTVQVMSGAVAHELGHAWLFLEGIDGLPLPIEEGFCNTLSYLYHSEFTSDESRFCMKVIARNPDNIYGDGFRTVYPSLQKHGLGTLLTHLKKHHTLP